MSNTVLRDAESPEWGKREKRCLWKGEPGSGPAESCGP